MYARHRPERRQRLDGLRKLIARPLLALALAAIAGTASAASFYLDTKLADLKPEDRVVVQNPQPVQLIFQFQTKGAPNARATKLLKQKVVETVKASGLFSDVSDDPQADGAILSITINDAITPKDVQAAEGKGFVTGLTFGLAGSSVTDHYVSTIEYVAGPDAPKISRSAIHDMIFQMGLSNTPPTDAVKMKNGDDAVYTMVRQIIANPLNDLARDPNFAHPPAPAPAPMTTTTAAPASPPAQPASATPPPADSAGATTAKPAP